MKQLVNDEIIESYRHVDLMVEKRAQIYRQEIELIEKAIADLILSMAKLEEEDIDTASVEELVELMKAKYGPESKYGKFLTGAVEELLRYGEESVEQDLGDDSLPMDQNAAQDMLSYGLGDLHVGNTAADNGGVMDEELPGYEDIDTVDAPPEYEGWPDDHRLIESVQCQNGDGWELVGSAARTRRLRPFVDGNLKFWSVLV